MAALSPGRRRHGRIGAIGKTPLLKVRPERGTIEMPLYVRQALRLQSNLDLVHRLALSRIGQFISTFKRGGTTVHGVTLKS